MPGPKLTPVTLSENAGSPAFVWTGERELINGCDEDAPLNATEISHTPRPCVPARNKRAVRCSESESTTTRGRLAPKEFQVAPPSLLDITPASVAAYNVPGISGSSSRSFTGRSGRVPLTLVHAPPALLVFQT